MGVCKNRTYVRVIGRGTADGDPRNSMGAFCRASWYAICAAKRSSSCAIRQHAHIASLNNRNTLQRAFLATRPRGTITAAPSLLNTRARRYRLVYRAAALTARGHVNPARVEDDHPALGNSKRERWGRESIQAVGRSALSRGPRVAVLSLGGVREAPAKRIDNDFVTSIGLPVARARTNSEWIALPSGRTAIAWRSAQRPLSVSQEAM